MIFEKEADLIEWCEVERIIEGQKFTDLKEIARLKPNARLSILAVCQDKLEPRADDPIFDNNYLKVFSSGSILAFALALIFSRPSLEI